MSRAHRRRYPALDAWRRSADRHEPLTFDDPITCAARYEATAAEFDRWADRAKSSWERATWRGEADRAMEAAVHILAEAERRARAAEDQASG